MSNSSLTAKAVLMLFPAVAISLSPTSANLLAGGQAVLTPRVTGSANTGVQWSLSPNLGTIDSTGLYTTPSSLPQDAAAKVTVIAQQVDTTRRVPDPTPKRAIGIHFTTNANGLQAVIFNGTNYNWVYSEGLLTVVRTQPPGGSVNQYYNPVCVGTFTATSVTRNCSAGGDSFTLTVSYDIPSPDTIRANMVFTNNSVADTVPLASISTLGVQAPFVPATPSNQAVGNATPVVAVNFGTGQFATWMATPGPNVTLVETCGWTNVCKNATQLTNIGPGQTITASVLLRFTTNVTENTLTLAPEAYTAYRTAYPYLVNWPDRRPIYAWFMSDHGHQSATNPRGYLNGPTINASNIPAFTAAVMAQAQSIINSIKVRPVQPQGIVLWDVEGQEFVQPTSYIGDPRVLGEGYAPEMNATADQLFALFKNAGLKVGVTLRPNNLQWGPLANLPTTCNSNASPAFIDYYIAVDAAFQKKFYACFTANTWTLVTTGNGWQTVYRPTQVQQVTNLLLAKVAYARARWGTTLYYVDSTVWNGGAVMTADIFRALQTAYPDSLFMPEESYVGSLAVAIPYAVHNGSLNSLFSQAVWRYAYPNGAQVTNLSDCAGNQACWRSDVASYDIGQKIGDIALYSVPQQLSSTQLSNIEGMIQQARREAGSITVTDSLTGTAYSYRGNPATVYPQYPVKMRVYFADTATDLASSTTYCENGSWIGTNSCTLNLTGLTVAQIRYYDFEGNLVVTESAGPR